MAWNKEDKERLAEIRNEMLELGEEAKNLIRVNGSRFEYENAKAYFLGHILAALDNGEYVERETLLRYLQGLGYDSTSDSFDDESEEEEDCDEDDEEEEKS